MDTRLIDLGSTPVRLDTPENDIGAAGGRIALVNVGDDAGHWLIAAAAPSGLPGFPVVRGQKVELSLPGASNGLWAWSLGRTRIAVTPLAGEVGIVPGPTGVIPIGITPIEVPQPLGSSLGDGMSVANVGPNEAIALQGDDTTPPDPIEGGIPLAVGKMFDRLEVGPDGGASIWVWSPKGTTILTTLSDSDWRIG